MILNIKLTNECCMANFATAYIKSRATIKLENKLFDLKNLFFKNKKIEETKEIAQIVLSGYIREEFAKINLGEHINQDFMEKISEYIKYISNYDLKLANIKLIDFKFESANMIYN